MHAALGSLDDYPAVTQRPWVFHRRGEVTPKAHGRTTAAAAGREVAWRARDSSERQFQFPGKGPGHRARGGVESRRG